MAVGAGQEQQGLCLGNVASPRPGSKGVLSQTGKGNHKGAGPTGVCPHPHMGWAPAWAWLVAWAWLQGSQGCLPGPRLLGNKAKGNSHHPRAGQGSFKAVARQGQVWASGLSAVLSRTGVTVIINNGMLPGLVGLAKVTGVKSGR